MKDWIVECEETISATSEYIVSAASKAEARQIVLNQKNEKIIDKPKTFETEIEVTKIISVEPI